MRKYLAPITAICFAISGSWSLAQDGEPVAIKIPANIAGRKRQSVFVMPYQRPFYLLDKLVDSLIEMVTKLLIANTLLL